MIKCALCQGEMTEVNGGFFCANCMPIETREKEPWYLKLAKKNEIWYCNNINKFPDILSCEYNKIRYLLGEGHVYGVLLQLKDVFEIILKLPILIGVAEIYEANPLQPPKEIGCLINNINTLGSWKILGDRVIKKSNIENNIRSILTIVLAIYTKNDICTWRNDEIGHGALKDHSSQEYQNDIESKIGILTDYLKRTEHLYRNIAFEIIDEQIYCCCGKKKILLPSYIIYKNDKVYLFDTYNPKKHSAYFLDYVTANKSNFIKEGNEYFNGLFTTYFNNKQINDIEDGNDLLTNEIYNTCIDKKLNYAKTVYENKEIRIFQDIYSQFLSYDKGVFLLQGSQYLGKTTFVKTKDEQLNVILVKEEIDKRGYEKSLEVKKLLDETNIENYKEFDAFITYPIDFIRAYYINNTHTFKVEHFTSQLHYILTTKKNNYFSGIQPLGNKTKEEVARLLNEVKKKICKERNLIFFLDGADDIQQSTEHTIFDMIPSSEMLDNGIFIILTARTKNELSLFTKRELEKIKFTSSEELTENSNRYVLNELLCPIGKEQHSYSYADSKLFEDKGARGVVYKLIESKSLDKCEPIKNRGDLLIHYMKNLEKLYGRKYFDKILDSLLIIATAFESLTIEEISFLLEGGKPRFEHLIFIKEITIFLDIIHNGNTNNTYSLIDEEWKTIIINTYKVEIENLVNNFYRTYERIDEKEIIPDDEEFSGEIYLLSYMIKYFKVYYQKDVNNCRKLFQEGSTTKSKQRRDILLENMNYSYKKNSSREKHYYTYMGEKIGKIESLLSSSAFTDPIDFMNECEKLYVKKQISFEVLYYYVIILIRELFKGGRREDALQAYLKSEEYFKSVDIENMGKKNKELAEKLKVMRVEVYWNTLGDCENSKR